MLKYIYKSKIHRARITHLDLYYEGSITVDKLLLDAADILPYERVQVLNLNTGARIETYTIPAKKGSGIICLNGPTARTGQINDEVIIISYALMDEEEIKKFHPKVVYVDKNNKIKKVCQQK
jgi:aspartate 1-decarboxylase